MIINLAKIVQFIIAAIILVLSIYGLLGYFEPHEQSKVILFMFGLLAMFYILNMVIKRK